MDIQKIDLNFVDNHVEGAVYQSYAPSELGLEGFAWREENNHLYHRLPERILSHVSDRIQELERCTAGGVIRFLTDSRALQLSVTYEAFWALPHMPLTGQAGFDIYVRDNGHNRLLKNFTPIPQDIHAGKLQFEFSCLLPEGLHEYRIYMPLYVGLEALSVELEQGSRVLKAPQHSIDKTILFYGSSITQGACASRPSNCHAALLSAMVDAEQINLGFSGNALGEQIMAETISELDLSCFVMDYDYNAPTAEHLRATHEPFFQTIRAKHPDLPVIFISRPYANPEEHADEPLRRDIIMQTYIHAKEKGDTHVYFVDGMHFFAETPREMPTVDLCHPTDLGFYYMTKAIAPVLKEALQQ